MKRTKVSFTKIMRKAMALDFPDFTEIPVNDTSGFFIVFTQEVATEKIMCILFQRDKWGHGLFAEVIEFQSEPIWDTYSNNPKVRNRIGYWRYSTESELISKIPKIIRSINGEIKSLHSWYRPLIVFKRRLLSR